VTPQPLSGTENMPSTGEASSPLSGLKVLDLATFIAAPFAAGLLAELGADVIKVEQPGTGDAIRDLGTKAPGKAAQRGEAGKRRALFWALEGRGRRSVTLNLRVPRGQELALDLIRRSDIVVENFRPGTLERWNLGYERMREVNPGVILLRVSAYGQTGPYASRPGFGRIAQAFGGLTYLAGHPDRPPVLPGSATLADYAAGLYGAFAILGAVQYRHRTGKGQVVDVSLYESIFRFTDYMALAYDALGAVRERAGSQAHAAPHDHYPTADGKWVAVACTADRIFRRLAIAMGEESWADEAGYETMEQRVARRGEVDARVAAWTRQHSQQALCALLDEAEVPNSPIYSIADIFQDPHYQARGTLVPVDDPVIGPVHVPAPVPRFSESPAQPPTPAPELGQHNAEVYGELGLSEGELERLKAEGVI
jgi:crotonobetainyl-CoA:carnitine CoA-transferase CaiB-like acyl-CoA transferase